MCRLQIGIALVGGVALAIVSERHNLVRGLDQPLELAGIGAAIIERIIFVDIVAQEQHRIQRRLTRDRVIGVEQAVAEQLARGERQHYLRRRADWQRVEAPGGGADARRLEPIPIVPAGLEALRLHLHRPVAGAASLGGAALDRATAFALRHHPAHRHAAVAIGGDARPKDRALWGRIAARDAMREGDGAKPGRGTGDRGQCRGGAEQPEGGAAIDLRPAHRAPPKRTVALTP